MLVSLYNKVILICEIYFCGECEINLNQRVKNMCLNLNSNQVCVNEV